MECWIGILIISMCTGQDAAIGCGLNSFQHIYDNWENPMSIDVGVIVGVIVVSSVYL